MLKLFIIVTLLTVSLFANDKALKLIAMQKESRVALIIGNNNYKSRSLSKLNNPINDARAIRKILSIRNFEIIYQEDATRRVMNKKLKLFYKKIRNGAVGFLYFSGHGLEVDGENYLIPIDANIEEKDDVDNDSISVDTVLHKMQSAGNRLNIAVLDACRNDPFSKGVSGGLAKVEPEGIFVAYATSAGKVASDGKRGSNGLFTKHLIKYMKQDGLGLYDVFKKTREKVFIESGRKQRPAIYDQVIGEEFFFTLPKQGTANSFVAKSRNNSTFSFKNDAPSKYSLTINQTPSSARVSITNIKPRYYDGIKLVAGTYNVKVSKKGYLTKRGDIKLDGDLSLNVVLDKEMSKIVTTVKKTQKYSSSQRGWNKKIFRGKRSYSKNSSNTVKDNYTGLIWQKGKSSSKMKWSDTKGYCQNLSLDGYKDWRVPTYRELYYLADRTKYAPAIDSNYFDESSEWYWSSTVYKNNSSRAWIVLFRNGNDFYYGKSDREYVRCVRERQ